MSDEMEARELDATIAELVMGWRWFECAGIAVLVSQYRAEDWLRHPALYKPLSKLGQLQREHLDGVFFYDSSRGGNQQVEFPRFSTNIAAAFTVIERMRELGFRFDCYNHLDSDQWTAAFATRDCKKLYQVTAKTLPLAIARAALQAVRGEET